MPTFAALRRFLTVFYERSCVIATVTWPFPSTILRAVSPELCNRVLLRSSAYPKGYGSAEDTYVTSVISIGLIPCFMRHVKFTRRFLFFGRSAHPCADREELWTPGCELVSQFFVVIEKNLIEERLVRAIPYQVDRFSHLKSGIWMKEYDVAHAKFGNV